MPAQAYTVNSGLTILGKGLDAGATFNGDVAKGIGQLKAGQLMKYVVNDARRERHLDKDDGRCGWRWTEARSLFPPRQGA